MYSHSVGTATYTCTTREDRDYEDRDYKDRDYEDRDHEDRGYENRHGDKPHVSCCTHVISSRDGHPCHQYS